MLNILVVGTGYVGLTTGTGLAELGHKVYCIDKDLSKIEVLNNNQIPIYEPGLLELVQKNIRENRLSFHNDLKPYIFNTDIIFLAVGTPENEDGSANLSYLYQAVRDIISCNITKAYIVIKSTVPVNTNNNICKIFQQELPDAQVEIISNPEFLREGFAVHDFFNPARTLIGLNSDNAKEIIEIVYKKFIEKNIPIFFTDPNSAELAKYAANAFLATKIAFINEISDLCEYYNANIEDVATSMGLDDRIGKKFLKVGPGFGGSCFPKDILALNKLSVDANRPSMIVSAVIEANRIRTKNMSDKILKILDGTIKRKKITCLGASFKANTDDIRESPALKIIEELINLGSIVNLYDPVAIENVKKIYSNKICYFKNITEACDDTNAIIILTEWEEFKGFDFASVKDIVLNNVIIDLRNILNKDNIIKQGFKYYPLGI
ncbi:MAG: UDP-glucose dehydrogenase family protein [Alphaproteobacteria bacterium]